MANIEITIGAVCARWRDPESRPLFKGKLISGRGDPNNPVCRCAQGDVLHLAGWSDDVLRSTKQSEADREVARLLDIPIAQAILLRQINDQQEGCPQDVLDHPERVLGDQATRVLKFWWHLDAMLPSAWDTTEAAVRMANAMPAVWDAALDAAWKAARTTAMADAVDAAGKAARAAAWDIAAWYITVDDVAWAAASASNEIQGASRLDRFYFLPMFGINHPSELDERAQGGDK